MEQEAFKVGVVGSGKMGRDLFDLFIKFQFPVTLICRHQKQADELKSALEKKQNRALKYGLVSQEQYKFIMAATKVSTDLRDLKKSSLVIEAISEIPEAKKALFAQIEKVVDEGCILASNTSSIPVSTVFEEVKWKQRCLGLHFFHPVSLKNIVEINKAWFTTEDVVTKSQNLLNTLDRTAIVLDPGSHFLANRIFLPLQAECCRRVEKEKTGIKEIDTAVRINLFPLGIFEFFDQVGNDIMLQSIKRYSKTEPDDFSHMIRLLEEKVAKGMLGVKTQQGFYRYPLVYNDSKDKTGSESGLAEELVKCYFKGASRAASVSGLSKDTIDLIAKDYMMVETGPFELAESKGIKIELNN